LEDFEGEDERESLLMQSLQAIRNVQHKVSNLSHTLSRTAGMSNTVPIAVSVCEDAANVQLFVECNAPQKFRLKFTVKRDSPLEVLLKILSHANNTPQSMICLKYDGIIVEPSKTPAECFMEDDDVLEYTIIDAPTKKNTEKHEQRDNAQPLILEDPGPNDGDTNELDNLSPIKITESKYVTDEEDIALQLDRQIQEKVEKNKQKEEESRKNSIKITVKSADGEEFKFRMQKTDPFSKMILAVATKRGVSEKVIALKFEGEVLKPKCTPEDFDMEDGDLIDLHVSK